jgi:hypothetical protein
MWQMQLWASIAVVKDALAIAQTDEDPRGMCFVLYIATPKPLPIVPWNGVTQDTHTNELTDDERAVAAHFTHRNVYSIGSANRCGCGFRNASHQQGSWPAEEWRPEGDTQHLEAQPSHERLMKFLLTHLEGPDAFEFYGVWSGDEAEPPLSDLVIPFERLQDLDFWFRHRGRYRVTRVPN